MAIVTPKITDHRNKYNDIEKVENILRINKMWHSVTKWPNIAQLQFVNLQHLKSATKWSTIKWGMPVVDLDKYQWAQNALSEVSHVHRSSIHNGQKQAQCPWIYEWLGRMSSIYTME